MGAAEYYDLRRYRLASRPGTQLTDDYLGGALVAGAERLGIGPVGAFPLGFISDRIRQAHYLLPPSMKLETLKTAGWNRRRMPRL